MRLVIGLSLHDVIGMTFLLFFMGNVVKFQPVSKVSDLVQGLQPKIGDVHSDINRGFVGHSNYMLLFVIFYKLIHHTVS